MPEALLEREADILETTGKKTSSANVEEQGGDAEDVIFFHVLPRQRG